MTILGKICFESSCDECKDGYYIDTIGGTKTCILKSEIRDGFGIESQLKLEVVSCSDANCKVCVNDNTKCEVCSSAEKYSNIDTNFTCTDVPVGYGFKEKNPDVVEACDDRLCEDCVPDYKSCVGCKIGSSFNELTGVCGACDVSNGKWVDGKHCRSCHSTCEDLFIF